MKKPKIYRSSGFTLIELMVAVAVMALTLMFGLPSIKTIMAGNRLSASVNDMVIALQMARSESIKRGKTSTVGVSIHTDNKGNPSPNKWIVFLGSSTLPTSKPTPGTGILVQGYETASGVTLTVTSVGLDDETPIYLPDGRLKDQFSPITMEFTIAGGLEGRILTIQPSGRVSVACYDDISLKIPCP
ncbi:putative General secretion pathway protein H [Crenothrix polyspora]|uniref:Type II secretion system protein H n=1 Tax=Crenothrix polyspora TaxID=360316 RepID=A0A1R4H563_9GAMM|nr:GspH/FimT family pseudopilin [Crenothrix polyspora]SJM91317.1 putative General secretion pathway protein H [Crenothrix polyspora]